MSDDPSFDVPERPERHYPASGGVEYESGVVFSLSPTSDPEGASLVDLLADVLDDDRYVRGDFFDLPAPAYLVRDTALGTSFRTVVRKGGIQLHVLPHTDTTALENLYRALDDATDVEWSVEREPGG